MNAILFTSSRGAVSELGQLHISARHAHRLTALVRRLLSVLGTSERPHRGQRVCFDDLAQVRPGMHENEGQLGSKVAADRPEEEFYSH